MALPAPLISNISSVYGSLADAYSLGDAMRKRNLLLEAGAVAAGGAPTVSPSLTQGSSPAAYQTGSLVDRIVGAESGGNATARNPNSSATGAGQFIASTWLDMVRRHRPDLAAGKTPADILALRNDPNLSREMTGAYAAENSRALQSAGLPVTNGTQYLSHFAGPAGAKTVLSADPSTPVSRLLQPDAVRANPFLAKMTAGDLRNWAERKVGGRAAPAAPGGGLAAASNVLLRGGEINSGLALQDRLRKEQEEAEGKASEKQKEMWGIIGDLALTADTPEKWARAVGVAKANGLDVDGLDDFAARDLVLARSGRMKTAIDLAKKDEKVYEVGGNLVRDVNGQMQTVYSAPAAPAKPFQLQAADRKEVYEADEAVESGQNVVGALDRALQLNQQAYSGPTAGMRGYVASQFGADGGVATEELENVVLGQVLDSLKATFGAAPTEGERQILVDVQGSINKSPEVRERVYKRAQAAAQKRMLFNREKAGALRGGEYFQPGYSPATQAPQAAPAPATAAPPANAPVRVTTPDEAMRLPPGTQFVTPDGRIKVRP